MLVASIVRRARAELAAGADVDRIHRRYLRAALRHLEDVEAYAVLAASDDAEALAAIERLLTTLADLRDELGRQD
jgi:hypothetical protein